MAERESLTACYVRQILDYNPDTGVFTWRERPCEHFKTMRACSTWNSRYAGTVAGTLDGKGYYQIGINQKLYRTHRLAWLWMTDSWPKDKIDHRDTCRSNNRWVNLREATQGQNLANMNLSRRNKSGFKGVSWKSSARKWQVFIQGCYLGLFDEDKLEDAATAYAKAASEFYGEFSRIG